MLFYFLSTDDLIVEIESIPESIIKMITPSTIHNPVYISYTLDCGKIISIADATGIEYDNCTMSDPEFIDDVVVNVGDIFQVENGGLPVKKYQIAVVSSALAVADDYSGTHYTYFDSGLISGKFNYKDGILRTSYYYRNDAYNTLEGARIYDDNETLEAEYVYDDIETLIMQKWYNSNGNLYHTQSFASQHSKSYVECVV